MSIYPNAKSKAEKIYRLYHDIKDIPICHECSKPLAFINFKNGYGNFCNDICEKKYENRFKQIDDNFIISLLFENNKLIYPRLEIDYLKSYHIYDYLINRYIDSTNITEIVYRIKNKIEIKPLCKICGKPAKFIKYSIGFANTCESIKCSRLYNEEYGIRCGNDIINDNYIIQKVSNTIKLHDIKIYGLYNYLLNRFDNCNNIYEAIYRIKNGIETPPICPICGKPLEFISIAKGYKKTCSFFCSTRYNTIEYYKKLGYNIAINSNNITIFNGCNIHHDIVLDKQAFLRRLKNNECICPICNPHNYTNIEEIIGSILEKLNIKYYYHDRKHIYPYELDIYIPNYNIGIECNGIYWHSAERLEKYKHKQKLDICESNNIRLITFWEDTILNNQNKIEGYLKSVLGLNKKIYARNCVIREIDSKTSKEFIDNNHLQGNINASIRLGLFLDDALLQVMTFGKTRKPLGGKQEDGIYELYRLCSLNGYTVIGGASKLLNYFKNNYQWHTIISYCDNDISQGNVYEKIGFSFDKNCDIGYWYYDKKGIRYNRYNLRKDKVDDGTGRTADEILKSQGYIKCYNSGNKKYIIKKDNQL